jgi:AcrR family transcriptional regulator
MDTKTKIKQAALKLFNQNGLLNVTLRDVAADISRSYGNITYHFKNKEVVVEAIYYEMLDELSLINKNIMESEEGLFSKILMAPSQTFDLTMKYLFLYVDFVEIRRNFNKIYKHIDENNKIRMNLWLVTLKELQNQKYLRSDLNDEDLFYLMELSGVMRTFFFLKLNKKDLQNRSLKSEYVTYVNKLLYPYLTAQGKSEYQKVISGI